MLNLVRGSCKTIGIETQDLSKLINFISTQFKVTKQGAYSPEMIDSAFADSQEGDVLILVTSKMQSNLSNDDIAYILLLKIESEVLLSAFINNKIGAPIITEIKLCPRILILRTVGDIEKVIDQVQKDIGGTIVPRESALENIHTGTVVYFSNNALHKPISLMNTHHECIHNLGSYYKVFRFLRNQNLKYLNIGIDNTDWYELKIKIYDAYGRFDLHYNRMRYVLEKLEHGMILGEAWGTDMASIFQTVGIYKVRFFTFKTPLEIKELLVGLEYLDDGERIVDYDLYDKRKKIHWDQVRTKEVKGKVELGIYYRKKILALLNSEEKAKLKQMETEILSTKS
jgi:predicted enzyme related to lactoylglutathione lyase